MLHEKPFRYGTLDGDVDGRNMALKREKRRRRHLAQSSSSDAPTATAQGHQTPIPYVLFGAGKAAKDHQGPISGMAIIQAQNHALLPRMESMDSGEEEEDIQGLFGPDVNLSVEDQISYGQILKRNIRPPIDKLRLMSWMDNDKVQVRQGRYRIAYEKAMNPESELNEEAAYTDDEIDGMVYFRHLEDGECFEWFFHPDDSWIPGLNDYQRIALRNVLHSSCNAEYHDVEAYREFYHTYEMDADYVKFYGELSRKIKWIEDFLHIDIRTAEWREIETRGWRQALKIATQFHLMTVPLASFAFNEYIWDLREDAPLKDLDLVYFEIWRLVVKGNRNYIDAVREVGAMDKYHAQKRAIEAELKGSSFYATMKQKIDWITRAQGIDLNTEDDEALALFRKEIAKSKIKNMAKYAAKRMEVGEQLNLHKSSEVPGPIKITVPATGRKRLTRRVVPFAPEFNLLYGY